jgi:ATP-dependent Clp protease, protease subunit
MVGLLGALPPPRPLVIGFNLVIDRIATMRLMGNIGGAIDRGTREIMLCITSPGGAPDQAFYAYELLRNLPIDLSTFAMGPVQSAAVTIFLAGQKRYAVPEASFLLHKTTHAPAAGVLYVQDQLTLSTASVRADDARFIAIAAERTGRDASAVRRWMVGQKFRTAQWALENGLLQEIRPFEMPLGASFFQVTVP